MVELDLLAWFNEEERVRVEHNGIFYDDVAGVRVGTTEHEAAAEPEDAGIHRL